MKKEYTIQASVKKYALYEVDENGRPTYETHEYEGVDVISYIIVDSDNGQLDEDEYETFDEAKVQCDLLNSNVQ